MSRMRRTTPMLLLLSVGCVLSRSQPTSERAMRVQQAEQVAAQFLGAVERKQWTAAAALIDPAFRGQFRENMLRLLTARAQSPDVMQRRTGGLVVSPVAPPSPRTHEAAPVGTLRGARTLNALAALPPDELMAGSIEVTQQLVYSGGKPAESEPKVTRRISDVRSTDDTTSLVRYTVKYGSGTRGEPAELGLLRRDLRWYVIPNRDIVSAALVMLFFEQARDR